MSELESNVYVARQNQIRQAWVKEISAEQKAVFSGIPQDERFALYAEIDSRVNRVYRLNVSALRGNKPKLSPADIDKQIELAAKTVAIELLNSI